MARAESLLFGKIAFLSLVERREEKVSTISGELSPTKILVGQGLEDRAVAAEIRKSLNPRWNMGLREIIPLADLDGGRFVCKPIPGENGGGKRASLWLNPQKWQPTLDEFAQFAQSNASRPLHFLVEEHMADDTREHVLVKPVMIDSSGVYESGLKYGLQINGRMSLGRDDEATSEVYDLGYLNPRRVIQEEIALFQLALSAGR